MPPKLKSESKCGENFSWFNFSKFGIKKKGEYCHRKFPFSFFIFHILMKFCTQQILHTSSKWRLSIYNEANIAHHMMALVPGSTVAVVGSNIDK